MVKPELGTKRLCPNCGTKYYDLDRDPIVCPKCGTPFTAAAVQLRAAKVVPVQEDEVETEEAAPVDFVSLEEADAEASGGEEVPEIEDEELADVDPDIHDDDDTFLETDDEDEDIDGIDIDVAGEEEER